MIDITNCNKIIVDTIGKTEKIIEWYQQNKDWLDAEEFRIPIPSALVELPEEDIKFYYEQEGVFVRLHLYMGGVYVCNYRYDPRTQEIENLVFPAGLNKRETKGCPDGSCRRQNALQRGIEVSLSHVFCNALPQLH